MVSEEGSLLTKSGASRVLWGRHERNPSYWLQAKPPWSSRHIQASRLHPAHARARGPGCLPDCAIVFPSLGVTFD